MPNSQGGNTENAVIYLLNQWSGSLSLSLRYSLLVQSALYRSTRYGSDQAKCNRSFTKVLFQSKSVNSLPCLRSSLPPARHGPAQTDPPLFLVCLLFWPVFSHSPVCLSFGWVSNCQGAVFIRVGVTMASEIMGDGEWLANENFFLKGYHTRIIHIQLMPKCVSYILEHNDTRNVICK